MRIDRKASDRVERRARQLQSSLSSSSHAHMRTRDPETWRSLGMRLRGIGSRTTGRVVPRTFVCVCVCVVIWSCARFCTHSTEPAFGFGSGSVVESYWPWALDAKGAAQPKTGSGYMCLGHIGGGCFMPSPALVMLTFAGFFRASKSQFLGAQERVGGSQLAGWVAMSGFILHPKLLSSFRPSLVAGRATDWPHPRKCTRESLGVPKIYTWTTSSSGRACGRPCDRLGG